MTDGPTPVSDGDRPRLLLVDNYDSFTYNLAQELGELGADVEVVRNDAFTLDELEADLPDGVVISPGPGTPDDAGLSNDVVRLVAGRRPLLGVCLGHQCIGEVYGGHIVRAPVLVHGKTSPIYHRREGVLADLPVPFDATRYHSLVVDRQTLPSALKVTAETSDGLIMAMRHREVDVEGVQFHPESVLTSAGMQLLGTFVARCATAATPADAPVA
ncbi:aminodeoxychorismate/anthranilate synthase component II [Egicoccus sp. AB-alg2]|uniref:anthranilate synthase component II n=1 Tax=Egicoccus sp. AB-alg2 TaxID=3242693 RepID=UPI00359EB0C6